MKCGRTLFDAVVVVVTYNSEADIETCVRGLAEHFPQLSEGQAELHVVDNGSSDDTPAILNRLSREFAWLKLHLTGRNLGFGPANNLVLDGVPAEAYILLNPDARLVGDSFTPALDRLRDSPGTGVIGLPLVYPDGSPQTYTFMPSAWHRWLILLLGLRKVAKALVGIGALRRLMYIFPSSRNFARNHSRPQIDLDHGIGLRELASGESCEVAWVSGAAMVLSPAFLHSSCGFDPQIFLYGEDEDICIQARTLGYAVESLQTVPIVHKLGWGGDAEFSPSVARLKYDSLKYFINKNISGSVHWFLMRLLLPFYVYGRHILLFFRKSE